MKNDIIEITLKNKRKYTFCLDYDYIYNLLRMLDGIELKDINGNNVSIRAKDIERIRKAG